MRMRRVSRKDAQGQRVHVEVPLTAAEEAAFDAETTAEILEATRTRVRRAVIAEGVRRIGTQLPGFDTLEEIERLVTLQQVGVLVPSTDPAWVEGRRLYAKAKALLSQAATASLAQLQATDPTSDVLWAP